MEQNLNIFKKFNFPNNKLNNPISDNAKDVRHALEFNSNNQGASNLNNSISNNNTQKINIDLKSSLSKLINSQQSQIFTNVSNQQMLGLATNNTSINNNLFIKPNSFNTNHSSKFINMFSKISQSLSASIEDNTEKKQYMTIENNKHNEKMNEEPKNFRLNGSQNESVSFGFQANPIKTNQKLFDLTKLKNPIQDKPTMLKIDQSYLNNNSNSTNQAIDNIDKKSERNYSEKNDDLGLINIKKLKMNNDESNGNDQCSQAKISFPYIDYNNTNNGNTAISFLNTPIFQRKPIEEIKNQESIKNMLPIIEKDILYNNTNNNNNNTGLRNKTPFHKLNFYQNKNKNPIINVYESSSWKKMLIYYKIDLNDFQNRYCNNDWKDLKDSFGKYNIAEIRKGKFNNQKINKIILLLKTFEIYKDTITITFMLLFHLTIPNFTNQKTYLKDFSGEILASMVKTIFVEDIDNSIYTQMSLDEEERNDEMIYNPKKKLILKVGMTFSFINVTVFSPQDDTQYLTISSRNIEYVFYP